MAAAESARSAKRSPSLLWVPSETLRWMTGARSARSAGLLVGSTPGRVMKVQSAGQTLSRLLANRRCQRVRRLLGDGVSSSARSSVWIGAISALELFAVVVLVLVGAPGGEHSAGELEALFAEGLLLGETVGVAAKVPLEVRPAHLALVGVEMAVAVPAVRDHDPGVAGADQRVELLAVAVLGDLQERGLRGGRGPQRPALAAGPPAGLIDMHRALVQHPVLQLAMWAGQRV